MGTVVTRGMTDEQRDAINDLCIVGLEELLWKALARDLAKECGVDLTAVAEAIVRQVRGSLEEWDMPGGTKAAMQNALSEFLSEARKMDRTES